MRKVFLLLVMLVLFSIPSVFAQTWPDYILEIRGDTAVVKDYGDMEQTASTLNQAIALDTDVPAGRVYELRVNGYYPMSSNPTTPADRAVTIAGADYTPMVINDSDDFPPVVCGFGGNSGGIGFQNDLTVKNASVMPAASSEQLGWAFFGASAADRTLTLDNVSMEHTRWVMVQSNDAEGTSVNISNSYFVNLSGQPCRRNGGVYDNVNNNTTSMVVENSTHVMAQGMMYKFRNYEVPNILFNHNTFINISSYVFETLGYHSHVGIVNNIFVNCHAQPYTAGLDAGETDADNLPTGIINVDTLLEDMEQVDRKWVVDNNLVYWDERLDDLADTCNARATNGSTDWVLQTFTMNTRTQAMFDDDGNYPYLIEGVWYEQLPNFTNPENLLTTQVDALKLFSVNTVEEDATTIMPDWRLIFTSPEEYIYSDFPIPVDLSYDDADLLTAGLGFPLGDLNWFPADKVAWEAIKDAEHAEIEDAINTGRRPTGFADFVVKPKGYLLQQNYPNPFNPTTVINFTIPKAGKVTLKVYNSLGQEVATLMNGFATAKTYDITFNGSNLASGVYFYTLKYDNKLESKKMVLMK
jgi:hypothetical protein